MKVYVIMWDQNMGGNRGITCQVDTDCLDTAITVWENCCLNKLVSQVRNAKVYFNDKVFRPTTRADWPRWSFVWPEV